MRKIISPKELAAGILVIILTGGLLFFPMGLAFFYVLKQRQMELEKGELADAKNY